MFNVFKEDTSGSTVFDFDECDGFLERLSTYDNDALKNLNDSCVDMPDPFDISALGSSIDSNKYSPTSFSDASGSYTTSPDSINANNYVNPGQNSFEESVLSNNQAPIAGESALDIDKEHIRIPAPQQGQQDRSTVASKSRKAVFEPSSVSSDSLKRRKVSKKSPHNMIEKKYRTNINDRIFALCQCVPSLRVTARKLSGFESTEFEEDLQGLEPARKLNKATILSKAAEYILHLENANRKLASELRVLKEGGSPLSDSAVSSGLSAGLDSSSGNELSPNGSYGSDLIHMPTEYSSRGGRIALGAMTGLMVMSVDTKPTDGESGLSALPLAHMLSSYGGLSAAKSFVLVLISLYVITQSLLLFYDISSSKPNSSQKKQTMQTAGLSPNATAAALSNSASIAQLSLPGQKLTLQGLSSVGLESLRALLCSVGLRRFSYNSTALKGAIDAQIRGEDSQCTKIRILSALLKSTSAPTDVELTILNVIQILILGRDSIFEKQASHIAYRWWAMAQKLATDDNADRVDERLKTLLKADFDDVFREEVVVRFTCWALHHKLPKGTEGLGDRGSDSVTKDYGIKTAIDALAAWYSSAILRKVLLDELSAISRADGSDVKHGSSLEVLTPKPNVLKEVNLAISLAPEGSLVEHRAILAKAVLFSGYTEGRNALKEAFEFVNSEMSSDVENIKTYHLSESDEEEDVSDDSEDDESGLALSSTSSADESGSSGGESSSGSSSGTLTAVHELPRSIPVNEAKLSWTHRNKDQTALMLRYSLAVQAAAANDLSKARELLSRVKTSDSQHFGLLEFVAVTRATHAIDLINAANGSDREEVDSYANHISPSIEKCVIRARKYIGSEDLEIVDLSLAARRRLVNHLVEIHRATSLGYRLSI
ncbi:hypothetical protein CANCADRAFT_882 [Tortispora caseinolytica NRRL Y-17796]|uniref:BHLH domain-containing protein n=1 Tax=Tortispora caseinolytica NRRL Y-17796 TaxID=767744 RepID=A0A1E4TKX0_9ASCO|nr:hypothetical protein CANCADRAFT_882 [Tortispora caseinolytica NRRL Y-17796]